MRCKYCNGKCIKKGKVNRRQRYQCKICKKYQQRTYTYNTSKKDESLIKQLNNEGMGINSISRIIRIPSTSVQRIIKRLGELIRIPLIKEENQSYEIDELRTYAGTKSNESWVIYALNKATGTVINLVIGRRTKKNIEKVVNSVLKLNPKKIYTDGLNIYQTLVPKKLHVVFSHNINKIERKNLSLRTHLKRLSRKTICYTKQEYMLENCVKLYFFG